MIGRVHGYGRRLTPPALDAAPTQVVGHRHLISEGAARFQCAWPTVKRWVDRYRAGEPMTDRSSRPHRSPSKASPAATKRLVSLRLRLREGLVQLVGRVGVAPSTAAGRPGDPGTHVPAVAPIVRKDSLLVRKDRLWVGSPHKGATDATLTLWHQPPRIEGLPGSKPRSVRNEGVNMEHFRITGSAVAGLLLLGTASVAAHAAVSSIAIAPSSQVVNSGTSATWGWSWGGTGTYSPRLYYGDGSSKTFASQTNGGSGSGTHTYESCTTASLAPHINVSTAQANASLRVNGGPCR